MCVRATQVDVCVCNPGWCVCVCERERERERGRERVCVRDDVSGRAGLCFPPEYRVCVGFVQGFFDDTSSLKITCNC